MKPGDESPQPVERLRTALEGTPAARGKEGVTEAAQAMKGIPREAKRRHHRQVGGGQLREKGMFLEDGLVRPALGPVELEHHGIAGFEADAENAVFETVQCQELAARAQAEFLRGGEDGLRA